MLTRLIRTLRASFEAALAQSRPNDFIPTLRDYPLARPRTQLRDYPIRRTP
jgi:hypothetical protein